ncbi:hypothetical protein [Streptomyces tateyamensis]|nr:hypothetical protein [Streptomyces tateyamensis]
MTENTAPQNNENTEDQTAEEAAGTVPFTVELTELDSNPIVLQPKSY